MKKSWTILLEQFGHLSPEIQQFVERFGQHFERQGISRIGSRILGMLMVTEHPVSGEVLAEQLFVSRASVNTNARHLVSLGYVELLTVPGDRRDYYVFSPNAWINAVEGEIRRSEELTRILQEGDASVLPQHKKSRARIEAAVQFRSFYVDELKASVVRWKKRNGG
jgi:DNA-binding transcriptional regulator GbsR (MarR family)